MSIALHEKIQALEKRVKHLEDAVLAADTYAQGAYGVVEELKRRVEELEMTAARKPGPKPGAKHG